MLKKLAVIVISTTTGLFASNDTCAKTFESGYIGLGAVITNNKAEFDIQVNNASWHKTYVNKVKYGLEFLAGYNFCIVGNHFLGLEIGTKADRTKLSGVGFSGGNNYFDYTFFKPWNHYLGARYCYQITNNATLFVGVKLNYSNYTWRETYYAGSMNHEFTKETITPSLLFGCEMQITNKVFTFARFNYEKTKIKLDTLVQTIHFTKATLSQFATTIGLGYRF